MMAAIDGQDAHRQPIPSDRARRAESLIHLDRLSAPDQVLLVQLSTFTTYTKFTSHVVDPKLDLLSPPDVIAR
jgi:hypothetical protein